MSYAPYDDHRDKILNTLFKKSFPDIEIYYLLSIFDIKLNGYEEKIIPTNLIIPVQNLMSPPSIFEIKPFTPSPWICSTCPPNIKIKCGVISPEKIGRICVSVINTSNLQSTIPKNGIVCTGERKVYI